MSTVGLSMLTAGARNKKSKGQNLVEFALVVVILLVLVLGIVEFARIWMTFQAVTNSCREGARLAALPSGFTDDAAVTARVVNYLTSANLDPGQAAISVSNVDGATGTNATVSVNYSVNLLFFGSIIGLMDPSSTLPGAFTLTGTSIMRNE